MMTRFHLRTTPRLGALNLALLFSVASGGCGMSRQAQLEAVAKDWCMTIRASQVIPVYPLTADLQPGDIFLVQTTVDRQQEIYKQRGFLPLDNHLARLQPTGYPTFYDHSFLDPSQASSARLPGEWIRSRDGARAWAAAPTAAFPSYSFSVDSGAGLNLAVPVKGIPVGLALLGAKSANGSVSIQRASVLGIDIVSLYTDLQTWVSSNQDFLMAFAPQDSQPTKRNYLRVVTRVYATGQVDISLSDARSVSGGADVGQPRPVELTLPQSPESIDETDDASLANYTKGIQSLNTMLAQNGGGGAAAAPGAAGAAGMIPGGSLRVSAASSRFISMQQDFDPPLVIGYLGFDCEIRPGGAIGPPIPTHAVVDPESQGDPFRSGSVVRALYGDGLPNDAYERLRAAGASSATARRAVERLDALARHMPEKMTVYEAADSGGLRVIEDDFGERNYLAFKEWRAALESNTRELGTRLEATNEIMVTRNGSESVIARGSVEWETLQGELARTRDLLANAAIASEHAQACQFAGSEDLRLLSIGGSASNAR